MSASTPRGRGRIAAGLLGASVGVAVGASLLAPAIPGFQTFNEKAGEAKQKSELAEQAKKAEIDQAEAKAANAWIGEQAEGFVAGVLHEVPVVVVTTPSADPAVVDAVTGLIGKAGGVVSSRIDLSSKFFEQASADQLETLVGGVVPAGAQLSTTNTQPGVHPGQVIAAAFMVDPATGKPLADDPDRAIVVNALSDSGYATIAADPQPGRVTVVITGNNDGTENTFGTAALSHFVEGATDTGAAVVFAGGILSAADTGAIGLTRAADNKSLSTVDSIDYSYAQLATVLALRSELEGYSGHYGAAATAQAASPTKLPGLPPAPKPAAEEPPAEPAPAEEPPAEPPAEAPPAQ